MSKTMTDLGEKLEDALEEVQREGDTMQGAHLASQSFLQQIEARRQGLTAENDPVGLAADQLTALASEVSAASLQARDATLRASAKADGLKLAIGLVRAFVEGEPDEGTGT